MEHKMLPTFWVDWRRENDPNYTERRPAFALVADAVILTWTFDGPLLIAEPSKHTIVIGHHTLGYVGGGASYGGTWYTRHDAPRELILIVRVHAHRFEVTGMSDPLQLMLRGYTSSRCRKHGSHSADWEFFAGEPSPMTDCRRFGHMPLYRYVGFRMSMEEAVDFVNSIPCTCGTEGKR